MDNKPHRMVTGVTREQRVKRWSTLKADKNQRLPLMTDMEREYKNKMAAANATSNSQSVTSNTNKNADKFAESRSFAAFEKDGLPDIHIADDGVQNGYMIIQSPTLANGFRDPDYQMQVKKFIDQLTQQVDDRIAVYSKMSDIKLLPIVISMYQINTLKSRINANNNR